MTKAERKEFAALAAELEEMSRLNHVEYRRENSMRPDDGLSVTGLQSTFKRGQYDGKTTAYKHAAERIRRLIITGDSTEDPRFNDPATDGALDARMEVE